MLGQASCFLGGRVVDGIAPGSVLVERSRFGRRSAWAALIWRLMKFVIPLAALVAIGALGATNNLPWQVPYD